MDRGSRVERDLARMRPEPPRELYSRLVREARADRPRTSHGVLRTVLVTTAAAVLMLSLSSFALSAAGKGNPISSVVRVIGSLGPTNHNNNHNPTPAEHQYEKCNSGRGNLSETESGTRQTDSNTLINPHEGGRGPGEFPTDDCDPGNSGDVNRGGD